MELISSMHMYRLLKDSPKRAATVTHIQFRKEEVELPKTIAPFVNVTHVTFKLGIPPFIAPRDLCEMQNIVDLNLGGCHISVFPQEICALKRLAHLNLNWNKIKHIPQELTNCPLIYLDMRNNKLTTIPDLVCDIKYAHFDGNHLTDIPKFIREHAVNNVAIGPILFVTCTNNPFLTIQNKSFLYGDIMINTRMCEPSYRIINEIIGEYKGLYWEKHAHKFAHKSTKQAIMGLLLLSLRDPQGRPKFAEGLVWSIPREIVLEICGWLPFYEV